MYSDIGAIISQLLLRFVIKRNYCTTYKIRGGECIPPLCYSVFESSAARERARSMWSRTFSLPIISTMPARSIAW